MVCRPLDPGRIDHILISRQVSHSHQELATEQSDLLNDGLGDRSWFEQGGKSTPCTCVRVNRILRGGRSPGSHRTNVRGEESIPRRALSDDRVSGAAGGVIYSLWVLFFITNLGTEYLFGRVRWTLLGTQSMRMNVVESLNKPTSTRVINILFF